MNKKLLFFITVGLFLVGVCFLQEYKIPQLIQENYNCAEHPGLISYSDPAPFESDQHYINRHAKAFKNQIEEICG